MTKLKTARLIDGLSQSGLAKRIKVTQALISLFETGKIIPGERLKRKIEAALNLSPGKLWPLDEKKE